MKKYLVTYNITGRAVALVLANNEDEARAKADQSEIEDGTDQLIEWSFDEVEELSEMDNRSSCRKVTPTEGDFDD